MPRADNHATTSGIINPCDTITLVPPKPIISDTRACDATNCEHQLASPNRESVTTGTPTASASGVAVATHRSGSAANTAVGPYGANIDANACACRTPLAVNGRFSSGTPSGRAAFACRTNNTRDVTGVAVSRFTAFANTSRSVSYDNNSRAASADNHRTSSTSSFGTNSPPITSATQ